MFHHRRGTLPGESRNSIAFEAIPDAFSPYPQRNDLISSLTSSAQRCSSACSVYLLPFKLAESVFLFSAHSKNRSSKTSSIPRVDQLSTSRNPLFSLPATKVGLSHPTFESKGITVLQQLMRERNLRSEEDRTLEQWDRERPRTLLRRLTIPIRDSKTRRSIASSSVVS